MSILLEGTWPKPIEVRTQFLSSGVVELALGDCRIPLEDFRALVMYAMCNANLLRPDDPRLELLEDIRSLAVMQDRHGKRLSGSRPLARHFSKRA